MLKVKRQLVGGPQDGLVVEVAANIRELRLPKLTVKEKAFSDGHLCPAFDQLVYVLDGERMVYQGLI